MLGTGLIVLAMLTAGCGADDEDRGATSTPPAVTETGGERTTEDTVPDEPTTVTVPEDVTIPEPGAEEQPGGAGDELPASNPVELVGNAGRVAPARVRVAPFIAIRVRLRSGDGGRYGFLCGSRPVAVGPDRRNASALLAGRRAGDRIRCSPQEEHNAVVISVSAEPGP